MRENRPYGSEGGVALIPPSLPLSPANCIVTAGKLQSPRGVAVPADPNQARYSRNRSE